MTAEPRALALEALYEHDLRRSVDLDVLPSKSRRLVDGVLEHVEELDAELAEVANRWTVARMAPVDRNILRLALYELRHEPDTPPAVVINEAVELAKTYSTEKSGGFVNGVLGTLAQTSS